MSEHKLSDESLLNMLEQDAWTLHKEIGDCEGSIGNEIRWHAEGRQDSEKTISRIREHHQRVAELSFKLGQNDVHMAQVVQRLHERDVAVIQAEHNKESLAPEDHLDWLRPVTGLSSGEVGRHEEILEPDPGLSRRE